MMAVIAGVISILVLVVQLQTAGGLVSGVGDSNIRCLERERQALLKIKQEIIDDFGYLSSWRTEEDGVDCCKWSRIGCNNRTNHVIMLDLSSEQAMPLRGKISTSLLQLRHLNYLDLSYTDFEWAGVPNLLGSLSKLRYLNLSSALLAGTFPYQIKNLSSLYSLDIRYNDNIKFENLEWLSHLPSLRLLNMDSVDLSMSVDWLQEINMLPYLTDLSLESCGLRDANLPLPSYFNLSRSLLSLNLSSNTFSPSIFSWLPNISTNLLVLQLGSCDMQGPIPDAFWNMTSLLHFDLSSNLFEGGIPKSIGNLCSLQRLDLSFNSLTQPLTDLTQNLFVNCSANTLEFLYLGYNRFSGPLPDFTRFLFLKELYLSHNQLNGSSYGHLPNLLLLSLDGNSLNGNLINSIDHLPNLEYLDVSSNKFEGVVSESHLSIFSKLQYLDLSFNYLAVNLSSNWVPPCQLNTIGLSSCKLGPRFPNWLQWQKNVISLDISDNEISDIIPSWFSELSSSLVTLNLSNNQISGILPVSLLNSAILVDLHSNHFKGSLPHFSAGTIILDLSHNIFSGSISSVCNITNGSLLRLDFSNNLLSGSIPDCLTSMVHLSSLRLSNNKLSGEIPASIGSLEFLQSLNLHNNMLCGGLPLSLKNCSLLEFLDVGENRLSGEIPSWIGEGPSDLVFLSLRSNSFYGSIPLSLCYLTLIRVLDLSHNYISGAVPFCLSNFTVMAQNNNSREPFIYGFAFVAFQDSLGAYVESTSVIWKGRQYEFGKNLGFLKMIDLSSNSLSGNISEEITSLVGLVSLNLSTNNLNGTIPEMIGGLNQLQALDFSRNHLSGKIPASLANLNFLEYLNLSNNCLSGKIPSSTQLQSLDASAYSENAELCGLPLAKKCQEDETPRVGSPSDNEGDGDDSWHGIPWFLLGAGPGFIVGFWAVCLTLLLNSSWRCAYFKFLDNVKDRLYVMTTIFLTKMLERFQK